MSRLAAVCVAALALGTGGLRPPLAGAAEPGDDMIHQFLAARAGELHARFLDGAATRAEWEARRPRLYRESMDMLGLWPVPEKTPLRATVTGTLAGGGIVIEKLHYQSRPGLYVTANLYRPEKPAGRRPAVLYVCGHSNRGRDGNKTAFQDHGTWFARNGYVCLIVDTLQLGEVPGIHHGTYKYGRAWWASAGYTPAGVECWNGVRGIDYLVSRPDVDPDRVGVTGISGGGATTFWVAAADDRVKVAVPVSGMSDLPFYVAGRGANGHCDCMFLHNAYAWDWTTIAALVAPRPLLFADSDADRIFPLDGHRRVADKLRRAYALLGQPGHFADHVSPGGHDYRPDLRLAVFRWFNTHLHPDAPPLRDAEPVARPGPELRVFPDDEDVPQDALNGIIDESFVPRAAAAPPGAGGFEGWKEGMLKRLREGPFRSLPDRVPAAKEAGEKSGQVQPMTAEGGVVFHVVPASGPGDNTPKTGTLLVLNPDEEILDALAGWAKEYAGDDIAFGVLPRGGPPGRWDRATPPNYVERAHVLVGRTVDDGRVRDVAAFARYADESFRGRVRWRAVGRGPAGVVAAYAALFEPSIKEVVAVSPPATHRDGPHFLGVLRVLDVPDALGLLAPTKLTLVGAEDARFDRTAVLYDRAGAAGRLARR